MMENEKSPFKSLCNIPEEETGRSSAAPGGKTRDPLGGGGFRSLTGDGTSQSDALCKPETAQRDSLYTGDFQGLTGNGASKHEVPSKTERVPHTSDRRNPPRKKPAAPPPPTPPTPPTSPAHRSPRRRNLWFVLSAVAAAAVLILGVCLFAGRSSSPAEVHSVEDAIAEADRLSSELGYENALSELSEANTSSIDGDTYYRMQQNYRGIPVYGRTVVYATDENGARIAMTGNPVDVGENLSLTPTITQAQAEAAVRDYFRDELGYEDAEDITLDALSDDDLCIYNMDGGSHLAYRVYVGSYVIIVDAHSGDVLNVIPMLFEETTIGYAASDKKHENGVNVRKENETRYVLTDDENNLAVFNFDGASSSTSKKGENGEDETDWHFFDGTASKVVSDDNIFGNTIGEKMDNYETGILLLQNVIKIKSYYTQKLKCNSIGPLNLYYNDGYDNGENARGGFCGDSMAIGVLSMGKKTGVERLDVMAHEFTHFVSWKIMNWSGSPETGAINEALSDIFGEIIEGSITSSTVDWFNPYRSFSSPEEHTYEMKGGVYPYPSRYKGEGFADADCSFDDGGVHVNSTVISHAAYLMWNGIDGTASKKISTDDLAKLWYRAMLMMPSDCDFLECRRMLEFAADSMPDFTDAQRQCVREAFDEVGISDKVYVGYQVKEGGTVIVYYNDGTYCDDYDMTVTKTWDYVRDLVQPSETVKYEIRQPGTYMFTFELGYYYEITISHGQHTQFDDIHFIVNVPNVSTLDGSGRDNVEIYIGDSKPPVVVPDEEAKSAENAFLEFINTDGYREYTENWQYPAAEYAIRDINQDGIPELLIKSDTDGVGRSLEEQLDEELNKNGGQFNDALDKLNQDIIDAFVSADALAIFTYRQGNVEYATSCESDYRICYNTQSNTLLIWSVLADFYEEMGCFQFDGINLIPTVEMKFDGISYYFNDELLNGKDEYDALYAQYFDETRCERIVFSPLKKEGEIAQTTPMETAPCEPAPKPTEPPKSSENPTDAENAYREFIRSGEYLEYTQNWHEQPTSYAIMDLDSDGSPELLLQADYGDGWTADMIFTYTNTVAQVADMEYNWCGVWYSKEQNAITVSGTRSVDYDSALHFYRIQNGKLSYLKTLWQFYVEYPTGGPDTVWVVLPDGAFDGSLSEDELTEIAWTQGELVFPDEYDAILKERVSPEYHPISDLRLADSPASSDESADAIWRQKYAEVVEADRGKDTSFGQCYLMYIDGDDIPELLIPGIYAEGYTLYTCYGGELRTINLPGDCGFYYDPGQGTFAIHYGHQGIYGHGIYQLVKGEAQLQHGGAYTDAYEWSGEEDTYDWDGASVSEEEYNRLCTQAFDWDAATLCDMNCLTYEEIIAELAAG